MDVTKGSFNKWIYIEIVVCHPMEYYSVIKRNELSYHKNIWKIYGMYSAKWNKQFEKVT